MNKVVFGFEPLRKFATFENHGLIRQTKQKSIAVLDLDALLLA